MVIQVKYQDAPANSAPRSAQDTPILVERVAQLHKSSILIVEQLELLRSDVHHDPFTATSGEVSSMPPCQPPPDTLDWVTQQVQLKHQRALELLREISEWV